MALMLASCRPHPNWIPRNPKLIFQICQKLNRGFCIGPLLTRASRRSSPNEDTGRPGWQAHLELTGFHEHIARRSEPVGERRTIRETHGRNIELDCRRPVVVVERYDHRCALSPAGVRILLVRNVETNQLAATQWFQLRSQPD